MIEKEEHYRAFCNIHDQLSEYAKENNDMFLMVLFSVSVIKSCLKTFQEAQHWQQLIKITQLITDLFHKVNEIDFPDNEIKDHKRQSCKYSKYCNPSGCSNWGHCISRGGINDNNKQGS
ncbi:MAG: hypothetical protein KAV87_52025 [Desulfobacteraceae bacterium]|nr:hypothetical protein [Desulfobacteraceae bacterium]